MKKNLLLLIVAFFFLGSCATVPHPKVSRMPFPEHEYQNLAKHGTAIVKGQAFLKTIGGDVKFAAGNEVLLNPITSYANEWYKKAYILGENLAKPDSRLWNYIRKTVADGNGRFTFKNVPPGKYFVTTNILWKAAIGYQGALQVQGGLVTKKITVHDGDEIDVILTR